jgi:hypothetical protein
VAGFAAACNRIDSETAQAAHQVATPWFEMGVIACALGADRGASFLSTLTFAEENPWIVNAVKKWASKKDDNA